MSRFIVIFLSSILVLSFGSCTKDNFIETGLSKGRFDGNMLEYMHSNPYDWDSTIILIKHAGLVSLFEGKDYPMITFFGPTNHSIRLWMIQNGITNLQEVDPEDCKQMLLRHVVVGKYMRDDIPRGKGAVDGGVVGTGGITYTAIGGNKIWAYTFRDQYNGVADIGAVTIKISSVDQYRKFDIASSTIEPDNGVVHSLHYNFVFGQM